MKNADKFRKKLVSKLNKIILKDEFCTRKDKLNPENVLDSEITSMLESYIGSEFFENIVEKYGVNIDKLSFENIVIENSTVDNATCGFFRTRHGNVFLGFMCGGDWQFPVNAVLYYNHGFRIFVPKNGNNLKLNRPYNNEEVSDDFEEYGYDDIEFWREVEFELGI